MNESHNKGSVIQITGIFLHLLIEKYNVCIILTLQLYIQLNPFKTIIYMRLLWGKMFNGIKYTQWEHSKVTTKIDERNKNFLNLIVSE